MAAYRRAAVASTFSPTHRAVLAEAANFAQTSGACLEVLHAAKKTNEKQALFQGAFDHIKISPEIIWLEGESPAECLVRAAHERGYDLLVAGALERDPDDETKAFTGSVARRLLVEAPCDVLLLPRPLESPPPLTNAFFAVETGQPIAAFILDAVQSLGIQSVTLAVADTPFAAAIAHSKGEEPVDAWEYTESVAKELEPSGITVDARVIDSNTGFGLCDVAQSSGADIMIVCGCHPQGARSAKGGISLPAHLDWLRQVIPMRLLLSRGR